jgi:hypothetical protein
MAIVEAITAAAGIAKAALDIGAALDTPRSVVITIFNHTDSTWYRTSFGFESGGWADDAQGGPPRDRVDPQSAQIFGAKDRGFLQGVIGSIAYIDKLGNPPGAFPKPPFTANQLICRFANPFIGPNLAQVWLWEFMFDAAGQITNGNSLLNSTAYDVTTLHGVGEQKAPMHYTIRPKGT